MSAPSWSLAPKAFLLAGAVAAHVLPPALGQVDWHRTLQPTLLSPEAYSDTITAFVFDDAAQEAAVRLLYDDLVMSRKEQAEQFRVRSKHVGAQRTAFLEAQPDITDAWTEAGEDFGEIELILSWRAEQRALQRSFERDVRLLLDGERLRAWNRMTQQLRRERVLPEVDPFETTRSTYDLIALVNSLDLREAEKAALVEVTEDYGMKMEAALQEWEDHFDKLRAQVYARQRPLRRGEGKARRGIQEFQEELRRLTERVQHVNAGFAPAFSSSLDEEHQRIFLAQVNRRDDPDLFQRSPVDAAIGRLRDLQGLSSDRRDAMESIYDSYYLQRSGLRGRVLAARRKGAKQIRVHAQRLAAGEAPASVLGTHPSIEYLRRLRRLEKTTCTAIRSLFTDEQFSRLPIEARLLLTW